MLKIGFLTLILMWLTAARSYAAGITILQPYTDTLLCKVGSFYLPANTVFGYYDDSNIFYAELSDANGSFSSPTIIGVTMGQIGNSIYCTIPASTSPGTGYRIRIRATMPAEISSDNGNNIRVSPYPAFSLHTNAPVCEGTGLNVNAALNNTSLSPVSFKWTGPNNFISNNQSTGPNPVALNGGGYYVCTATYYGCAVKDSIIAQVVSAPTSMKIRNNSPVCAGDELDILTDCDMCTRPGIVCTYTMNTPSGIVNNNNLIVKKATPAAAGKYVVAISVAGCSIKDSIVAEVRQRPDSPWHIVNSPVCEGDTLKLMAGTNIKGASFNWSGPNGFYANSDSVNIPNVSKAAAGVYSVYAFFQGCPSAIATDSIVVGATLQKPAIAGKATVCEGDSIVLNATGTNTQYGSFEWNFNSKHLHSGSHLSIAKAQLANSGYYIVMQKYQGCTSPPDSFYVSIPDIPKPVVTINDPVCQLQKLTMHIEDVPGALYQWIGPAINVSAQNAIINNVDFSDSGKYVALISIGGCVDSTVTHVRILPLPKIFNLTANDSVCEGEKLMLSAESDVPSATFVWHGPNGFIASGSRADTAIDKSGAGYYYVQASSGKCISLPDSVLVMVKDSPEPVTIETNNKLSYGQTLFLSCKSNTPSVTYRWEGPGGFASQHQKDTIYRMTPAMGGKYTAIAMAPNSCTSKSDIEVVVDPISRSRYLLYPNPNSGKFTVKAELQREAHVYYQVLTGSGQVVLSGDVYSNKNEFTLWIDLGDVSTGEYLLHFYSAAGKDAVKISVVR